jgi:hypothetical protein
VKTNVREIGCEDETRSGANALTEFCISDDESSDCIARDLFG